MLERPPPQFVVSEQHTKGYSQTHLSGAKRKRERERESPCPTATGQNIFTHCAKRFLSFAFVHRSTGFDRTRGDKGLGGALWRAHQCSMRSMTVWRTALHSDWPQTSTRCAHASRSMRPVSRRVAASAASGTSACTAAGTTEQKSDPAHSYGSVVLKLRLNRAGVLLPQLPQRRRRRTHERL